MQTRRLCIIVEGKTESIFVKKLLAPYLAEQTNNYLIVYPIQNETSTGHKGGVVNYKKLIDNILTQAKVDPESYLTTFIDYYGLSSINFPQYESIINKFQDINEIVEQFEKQMAFDVKSINEQKFIPYIQLHEFEALYFADYLRFLKIDPRWNQGHERDMSKILKEFDNRPELINNNYETAPSKRLEHKLNYGKSHHTNLFTQYLENHNLICDALTNMSEMCTHFNKWLIKLTKLVE